jgi:hypothetical protein
MWTNVTVQPLEGLYNAQHQILTSSCHWCQSEAGYIVSRTSEISDRCYSDRACSKCAAKWSKPIL